MLISILECKCSAKNMCEKCTMCKDHCDCTKTAAEGEPEKPTCCGSKK